MAHRVQNDRTERNSPVQRGRRAGRLPRARDTGRLCASEDGARADSALGAGQRRPVAQTALAVQSVAY